MNEDSSPRSYYRGTTLGWPDSDNSVSALLVLEELGMGPLPIRIGSREHLDALIRETYNLGQRLTLEQLAEFGRRVQEIGS